jgi:hypothetical protein
VVEVEGTVLAVDEDEVEIDPADARRSPRARGTGVVAMGHAAFAERGLDAVFRLHGGSSLRC